jgi:hypothetical protein
MLNYAHLLTNLGLLPTFREAPTIATPSQRCGTYPPSPSALLQKIGKDNVNAFIQLDQDGPPEGRHRAP